MGLPDIVDFARNFSVMVRVQGPDPKRLKMRNHAFHLYNSGKTTISASGMLLPDSLYDADVARRISGGGNQDLSLVVTVASVVEPFLSSKHRDIISQDGIIVGRPELVYGAQIAVMVENVHVESVDPCWLSTQVLQLVDVPESSMALQSLIKDFSGSLEQGWEVGWSLASFANDSLRTMDVTQTQSPLVQKESSPPSHVGKSITRIAVLGVSLRSKNLPRITKSPSNKRGDFLMSLGSPFGVLSSSHFYNSTAVGSIANLYPPKSLNSSLLMADMRCLPGMEGSPVFGGNANIIGILIRPLKQKNSGSEVQLVIPWGAIAKACGDLLKHPNIVENEIYIGSENLNVGDAFISEGNHISPAIVEKAMTSVCLITIDDGVWASGIFLNSQGLILTNAHLLEPWRFGKAYVNNARNGATQRHAGFHESHHEPWLSPSKVLRNGETSVTNLNKEYKLSFQYKRSKKISVRLDHVDPWIWCDAKVVYVCKGALDVALLQLVHVPTSVWPIVVNFVCPALGSKVHVIGHGLFGPKCGFTPSVSSGVIAKIVKAESSLDSTESQIPAMLETTAAVHPGCSGGAVVNSAGQMIGLVTSNARHGGGTVIPHLNFSIPTAVLAPIFEFAKDKRDSSLLRDLDQPNKHLSSVWALMPQFSSPPKPDPVSNSQPSLLEDNGEVKGSRFAKFIAERVKLPESSAHLASKL